LANSAQALKRSKQAEKRRQQNVATRSKLRTYIKQVVYKAEEGDAEKTSAAYKTAAPLIDAAVNKGLIHKNKAARLKSRLNTRILKLQQA